MPQTDVSWYRLDNAAKIYPAIRTARRGSVYRMAVLLRETVDPALLQQALDQTAARFPAVAVRMHRGFFWYYFESKPGAPPVQPESPLLCRPIDERRTRGFLYRISYFDRRISMELFHSVTDGTGAITFLKSLTYHYLRLCGHDVVPGADILDSEHPFSVSEVEDSFSTYYDPKDSERPAEEMAYQITGTVLDGDRRIVTHGQLPLQETLALARSAGVTLTEYLTAVLLLSIYKAQLEGRPQALPIRVQVPVNLRRFFRSSTMRNFSSYIPVTMTEQHPGPDFDTLLHSVSAQMREGLTLPSLSRRINANVRAERNPAMRAAPLFLKNIAMRMAYSLYGEKAYTTAFSNLGSANVPESMRPFIERFEFVLGLGDVNHLNVTAVSYDGRLVVSFTRSISESLIEQTFFRFLVGRGLEVTIDSNEGVGA